MGLTQQTHILCRLLAEEWAEVGSKRQLTEQVSKQEEGPPVGRRGGGTGGRVACHGRTASPVRSKEEWTRGHGQTCCVGISALEQCSLVRCRGRGRGSEDGGWGSKDGGWGSEGGGRGSKSGGWGSEDGGWGTENGGWGSKSGHSHRHIGVHCQMVQCDKGFVQCLLWSEPRRRTKPQETGQQGDKLLSINLLHRRLQSVHHGVQRHKSNVCQVVKLVLASLLGHSTIFLSVFAGGLCGGGRS